MQPQMWEYQTLKFGTTGWQGGVLDVPRFDATLNQLGADGWELVAAFDTNIAGGSSRDAVAVFKRPRDGAQATEPPVIAVGVR